MNRKPERLSTLRRRIATGSAAIFLVAWAVVFGQSPSTEREDTAEAETRPQPHELTVESLILGLAAKVVEDDEGDEGEDDGPAPVTSSQS